MSREEPGEEGEIATEREETSESGPAQKRAWWKNPWAASAVIGVLFMTVMTPLMKHVPEPPAALGAVPMGVTSVGEDQPLWSPDRVTLVAFSRDGCFGAEEALFKARSSFLGTAFEEQGGLVEARSVVVVDEIEDAPKAISALLGQRSPYAGWPVAAVLAADAQPLRRSTPSEDGGCGAGLAGWMTIAAVAAMASISASSSAAKKAS